MIRRFAKGAAGIAASDRHAPALARSAFNLTSMIDVVFLLLMYFMLTTDFARPESALATVPPSEAPADPFALPAFPVEVSVSSRSALPGDFSITCDDASLAGADSLDTLRTSAAAAIGASFASDQVFVIRPTTDARWEHTLDVFSTLRAIGYTNVRLAEPAP